jgi:chromosome segregation ATPase
LLEKGNPSTQTSVTVKEDMTQFKLLKSENLKELMQNSNQQISKLNEEIEENQKRTEILEENMEKVSNKVVDNRIQLALLQYRQENVKANLERLEGELKSARVNLNEAWRKLSKLDRELLL